MQEARPARLVPGRSTFAESLRPTQIDALRMSETQLDPASHQLAALKATQAVARMHAGVTSEDRVAAADHLPTYLHEVVLLAGVEPAPLPFAGSFAWASSVKQGEPPSPETIAHGTVRMEDHPNYATLIEEARSLGAVIERGEYGERARVALVQFVDEAGTILEVRLELRLVQGMRYLDLEHEMGHLRQLERFGDALPPTRKVVRIERNAQGHLASGQLTTEQNSIFEYHNRLQEYIRLAERKVPPSLLEEHAEGLDHWRRTAETNGLGRAGSLDEWAQRYFSDIPALEARCRELGLMLVPKTGRW